ncbi:MAG TPA: 2-amino-4-hydroxy-6-hydroxymethyldihydropteridine diphosphokinase [Aestuariivirgaceae bacterium]|nr:2-amino-4-hydroxy-6-hydroxymethyldihydropteridine diphosphokinase [Aestuariivirgaceae bacterium]
MGGGIVCGWIWPDTSPCFGVYLQIPRCMILIGLGSNLDGAWGPPSSMLRRAIGYLNASGCRLVSASAFVRTSAYGKTDQPDFLNAVARIATRKTPEALLDYLQSIEKEAGRRRGERWSPRSLDLDILDFNGIVRETPPPVLPHPGIPHRPFVLRPIMEIAPHWRHPTLGKTAAQMLEPLQAQTEGRVLDC